MSSVNLTLIQVFLVVLIGLEKSNELIGMPPTVTVEHWIKTPCHPDGESVYSHTWTYGGNQDYRIRLDYIFDTLPQAFITNGIADDLVIPAAFVDKFMNGIRRSWIAMASDAKEYLLSKHLIS
jgi:hypothetical protein